MLELSDIFSIFFLTLGPLRAMAIAHDIAQADPRAARILALRAALSATLVALFVAFAMVALLQKWRVSLEAIQITGGLLLFNASSRSLARLTQPPDERATTSAPPPGRTIHAQALSPLAVPGIITPIGVVAILFLMGSAGNLVQSSNVLLVLLSVMALNLLGMLYARRIVGFIGLPLLGLLGWLFAVLQAGLAVQVVIQALRKLGALPLT